MTSRLRHEFCVYISKEFKFSFHSGEVAERLFNRLDPLLNSLFSLVCLGRCRAFNECSKVIHSLSSQFTKWLMAKWTRCFSCEARKIGVAIRKLSDITFGSSPHGDPGGFPDAG